MLIGDKKSRRGFTFFEVMVATAILATGVIMITKALLLSLDHQSYLTHRLYAMNLLEHQMTSLSRFHRDQESEDLPFGQGEEIHNVVLNNKPITFQFTTTLSDMEDLEDISRLKLTLSWRERNRMIRLSRSTYVHRR